MTTKTAATLGDRDMGKTVQAAGTLVGLVTSARWVDVTVRLEAGAGVEVSRA